MRSLPLCVYFSFSRHFPLLPLKVMGGSRGGGGLKNHKNIGFLCSTGPDPLKNHKATKPAFNYGPSSACQRNAISMAFCWRSDDDLFIAVFGFFIPSSTKKSVKFGPPLTKLSRSAHEK